MKDGQTRKLPTGAGGAGPGFLDRHVVTVVFASGSLAGTDVALTQDRVTLGRGSEADVVVPDESVSRVHAALELTGSGFRLRDLDSTNGVRVNGARVAVADLEHSDRFELGKVAFRYLAEKRDATPPTHHLKDE